MSSKKDILFKINFIILINFNLLIPMNQENPKKYFNNGKTYYQEPLTNSEILELIKTFSPESQQKALNIIRYGNAHRYPGAKTNSQNQ